MLLVPSSLPLGLPLCLCGEGKKHAYEGQNQHKAGEIVCHLEIHSIGHQLFTL